MAKKQKKIDLDKKFSETQFTGIFPKDDYLILSEEEVQALITEFSNTYINAVDNPLASQVIQRMILWNNEQLFKRSIKAE